MYLWPKGFLFAPNKACKSVAPRIICAHFPLVWLGQLCLKTIADWGRVTLRISFIDKIGITKDGVTSFSLIGIKGTFAQIWSCVWKKHMEFLVWQQANPLSWRSSGPISTFIPCFLPSKADQLLMQLSRAHDICHFRLLMWLLWWLSGKQSACSAGDVGSIPGSGRSSGEGNCNPLQCSC